MKTDVSARMIGKKEDPNLHLVPIQPAWIYELQTYRHFKVHENCGIMLIGTFYHYKLC